jgi:hypothetical protein
MSHPNGRRPRRRDCRVEPLEARDLPSVAPMLYASQARRLAGAHVRADQQAPQTGPILLRSSPFSSQMAGSYTIGPARLPGQSQVVLFKGAGGANQFAHGWFLMSLVTPTDPAAPIQGNANLIEKNVGQSGTELILDLTADPQSLVGGVPTRFSWTVDGSSSGFYIGATGSGTGRIVLHPSGRLPRGAIGAGHFSVAFQGQIQTTPITNILVF